jgi:AraC-like DNA-binding protein
VEGVVTIVRLWLKMRRPALGRDRPALKRIAELAGFAHMEYLSYFFKRATGESPRTYRHAHGRRDPAPDQPLRPMP